MHPFFFRMEFLYDFNAFIKVVVENLEFGKFE